MTVAIVVSVSQSFNFSTNKIIKYTFYAGVLLHSVSLLPLSTSFCIMYLLIFEDWLLTAYARGQVKKQLGGKGGDR